MFRRGLAEPGVSTSGGEGCAQPPSPVRGCTDLLGSLADQGAGSRVGSTGPWRVWWVKCPHSRLGTMWASRSLPARQVSPGRASEWGDLPEAGEATTVFPRSPLHSPQSDPGQQEACEPWTTWRLP